MLSRAQIVRNRLAGTLRQHPDADVTELRAELAVATLEDHIRRVVNEAPPLTAEQRLRLAALLAPGIAEASSDGEVA